MVKSRKELEADVVIIGGGACGLCAALTVSFGGATVVLIEKLAEFGGMTNWAEGMFAIGSKLQKKMKLDYTVEDRFKAHMEATNWEANPRLVRAFMEKTADTIDWLEELGAEFTGVVAHYPGAPFVWHMLKDWGREGLIKHLVKRAQAEKNIKMFLETPAKSIVKEGDRITGVVAEDKEGNTIRVKCKAVVAATGGYGDKREWVEKYCKAGKSIKSFMDAKQTGDAIQMAWDVGAAAEGMGVMQAFTFMPNEMVDTQLMMAALQPNLWINERGERFCDESIIWRFPVVTNALSRQPNARAYNLFDQDMVTFLKEQGIQFTLGEYLEPGAELTDLDAELERGVKEGKVFEANSVKELAVKIGAEPKVLEDSVNEYNACCDKNHDFLFAKDRRYLHAIRRLKFYASKLGVVIGITEGGIKINHKMEVLDKQFNVIPGLYAGGCCAGGLIGESYIIVTTGGSLSFAVNSGRMAGESVLKYLGK